MGTVTEDERRAVALSELRGFYVLRESMRRNERGEWVGMGEVSEFDGEGRLVRRSVTPTGVVGRSA
jgi:hypothetical protein